MNYLTNGDFVFPFEWALYWAKHFFVWSFQNGAVNADGIIRFPGRILSFFVFGAGGNITFEYFYLFSTLLIAFVSFFYFAKVFLRTDKTGILVVPSLLFAINPIFLGNISKIGLVLGVAMLPFCLALIKRLFDTGRFSFLLLAIFCLNISLLHPFTFTINLVILLAYFVYKIIKNKQFIRKNLPKLIGCMVAVPLLFSYFLLPLATIGTLNKDALSSDIGAVATDYTRLIDIANTQDLLTGLSLSKNVLKDYDFYNRGYEAVYTISIFVVYLLIFLLYARFSDRLTAHQRGVFIICTGVFLLLVALATATFFNIDAILKIVANMPAGWIFRSPLKWQLYIPVFLCSMLAIALATIIQKKHYRLVLGIVTVVCVGMNGYIISDVYARLLTPKSLTVFTELYKMDLDNKNLLLVAGTDCTTYMARNPAVSSELNQVLLSKNTQIKRVASNNIESLNLSAYDYLVSCVENGVIKDKIAKYELSRVRDFSEGNFVIYQNKVKHPYAFATSNIATIENAVSFDDKFLFAKDSKLDLQNFSTIPTPAHALGIQNAFDTLRPQSYASGSLIANLKPLYGNNQAVYFKNTKSLSYKNDKDGLHFSTVRREGYTTPKVKGEYQKIDVGDRKSLQITYSDPKHQYKNMITNSSFEKALWQKEVSDCFKYDDKPILEMKQVSERSSDGKRSLRLTAKRHTACTSPGTIAVEPGKHYLLSFDYQGEQTKTAGYSISYPGANQYAINERLDKKGDDWQTAIKEVVVPAGIHSLDLRLYAFPGEFEHARSAYYDNVNLVEVPDIGSSIFLTSGGLNAAQAPKVTTQDQNPTLKKLSVTAITAPFYIVTKDSYHPSWTLADSAGASKTDSLRHIKVNSTMNAWYVDAPKFCQEKILTCDKAADGSYSVDLKMEFAIQKWFYLGLGISSVTFISCAVYIVRDFRRARKS